MNKKEMLIAALLVGAAACSRFIAIKDLPNFTAIGSIALFGGAVIKDKRLSLLIPMLALFITDLIIGMYSTMWIVYVSFAIMGMIGWWVARSMKPINIAMGTLAGGVVFYLLTNLPFLYNDISLYSNDINGLIASYTAALPFYRNQLLGDLFYTTTLFGAYFWIKAQSQIKATA
ncbi:MAG: hypothetical protein RIQ89_2154 [Bacteroidota bacterium]